MASNCNAPDFCLLSSWDFRYEPLHPAYQPLFLIMKFSGWGMVTHTCKPNYLGGGNRRMAVQGQPEQKLARPYFKYKQGMVFHVCNSSYLGGGGKEILV
jgi:hypothetical protein